MVALKNNLDLEKLININQIILEGVIAGKSFYVGNIDLKEAKKYWKKCLKKE